jgi:hypothetical protein
MIRSLKKLIPYFLQAVDWGELLNGIACILLGMAFTYHYGFQVYWRDFLHIVLWFLFYKAGIFCLNTILSGTLAKLPLEGSEQRLSPAEFRLLLERFLWVLVILFIAMSFAPLTQLMVENGFPRLTAIIIALVYLGDLLYLIDRSRELLSGFQELFYGFITAFLLPSLFFSLTRDYLKTSLILMAFPLFLQLIAWKIGNNLESKRCGRAVYPGSMLERLDALNGLSVTATLLLLGGLTVFLDQELVPIWTKVTISLFGLATAGLVFRSVKKEKLNWTWAIVLMRLLPVASAFMLILALWNH